MSERNGGDSKRGRSGQAIVVGAGPAGLMAAERLAQAGLRVAVHEAMPSPGRKLLMAGRGGLNLTHSEPLADFLRRYGDAGQWLAPLIAAFPPASLRDFVRQLGQETFVGSSGRVFPKALKASPLLRAWIKRLARLGVELRLRSRWIGWSAGREPVFRAADGTESAEAADIVVLALGGASWPRLGSNGAWREPLAAAGVPLARFAPANCGFDIAWSPQFRTRFAGAALKPLALDFEGRSVRGEAIITEYGLEGGAVYALSAVLRAAIDAHGAAVVHADLAPGHGVEALAGRLAAVRAAQSTANRLRKAARLSPVAANLLREGLDGTLPRDAVGLAARIKAMPLCLLAPRPLERAISTAGGVRLEGVDENFMLKARPGTFVAGEMLDWEAPTGGYLLQACFATGLAAAEGALLWLGRE